MSERKYRPFGLCSYCLNDLETLDNSLDEARHIETKTPWKRCPEGLAGINRLKQLIGDGLKIMKETPSESRKRLRNKLERNSK